LQRLAPHMDTMHAKHAAQEIFKLLQDSDVSLFAGAGVSIPPPASLPSAMALKWSILQSVLGREVVPQDAPLFEQYLSAEMLELTMQSLNEIFGPPTAELLTFIDSQEPNFYHLFAARLAARGLINRIYTTNFDCLFERALAAEGVAYHTFVTDYEFAELLLHSDRYPAFPVIKLHGTSVSMNGAAVSNEPRQVKAMSKVKFESFKAAAFAEKQRFSVVDIGFDRTMTAPETLVGSLYNIGLHLSEAGQELLITHLKTSLMLVVGWSGFDLDLSPLFAENVTRVYWINHVPGAQQPSIPTAEERETEDLKNELRRKKLSEDQIAMALLAMKRLRLDVLPSPAEERQRITARRGSAVFDVDTAEFMTSLWGLLDRRLGPPPTLTPSGKDVRGSISGAVMTWFQGWPETMRLWAWARWLSQHGEYATRIRRSRAGFPQMGMDTGRGERVSRPCRSLRRLWEHR
jgi:hypothetical protein